MIKHASCPHKGGTPSPHTVNNSLRNFINFLAWINDHPGLQADLMALAAQANLESKACHRSAYAALAQSLGCLQTGHCTDPACTHVMPAAAAAAAKYRHCAQ
jgi:hypothetical protein